MELFWSGIFGLIVGSFLNVVVIRLPRGRSLVWPGSQCCQCHHRIAWYDNIPIVSYCFLLGKCRHCHESISVRYPLVEGLTAFLFMVKILGSSQWIELVCRGWPLVALLIAITFIDLEHRIIPDHLSLGGLGWGLLTSWIPGAEGVASSILGAMLGWIIFYSLARVYYQIRGRVGLGAGDVKLLAMLGSFLGPAGVVVTITVASIVGSIVGLIWASLLGRTAYQEKMQFAIPFGPFLVMGALVHSFFGDYLWTLLV